MIATESVRLNRGAEWTARIGECEIHLSAQPNERRLPFAVSVHAFSHTLIYQRFAQCTIGSHPGSFVGSIEVALQREGYAFLAVVGLYMVLFFDFKAHRVREVMKLFREETDDQGFYRMQLHPLLDGFLINYESGVARVRETGEVAWHRKMVWNDVFVREEDSALLFKNELNPKGFHISIRDGSKLPV